MIYVALRFDDPGPASDHGLETGIISRLQRYRAPATFAVIPFLHRQEETFPLQAAQVPHLIQAEVSGYIEIAQHGFSHEKRVASDGTVGEMVGLARDAEGRRAAYPGQPESTPLALGLADLLRHVSGCAASALASQKEPATRLPARAAALALYREPGGCLT